MEPAVRGSANRLTSCFPGEVSCDGAGGQAMAHVVDLGQLEMMTGGDAALAVEALGIFRQSAELWTKLLDVSADPEQWADAAHGIKGAARSVGAMQLGDACETAEKLGRGRPSHCRGGGCGDLGREGQAGRGAGSHRACRAPADDAADVRRRPAGLMSRLAAGSERPGQLGEAVDRIAHAGGVRRVLEEVAFENHGRANATGAASPSPASGDSGLRVAARHPCPIAPVASRTLEFARLSRASARFT